MLGAGGAPGIDGLIGVGVGTGVVAAPLGLPGSGDGVRPLPTPTVAEGELPSPGCGAVSTDESNSVLGLPGVGVSGVLCVDAHAASARDTAAKTRTLVVRFMSLGWSAQAAPVSRSCPESP